VKNLKKIFILAAIATLALVITACGQDDAPAAGAGTGAAGGATGGTAATTDTGAAGGGAVLSPDNPRTINAWIVTQEMAPAPDNRISALLADRLGVTINYMLVTPEQQDQQVGVMLAGGDIPELVGSTDAQARLVQGGALLRLDPFLDSGDFPLLYQHIAPYRTRLSWNGGGVEDGFYQFPNYNRFYGDPPIMGPTWWGTAFWMQKAVAEWHGFPNMDNLDLYRYFDMIEEYMLANPTIDGMPTIGFTFPVSGRIWGLLNPPLFLAGHPNNGGVMVFDGQAQIYANSEWAERYFRILNDVNARGLLDPETFTQTLDQYFAKLASGRVLGMHDQRWGFGVAYDALVANEQFERTWFATVPTFDGIEPWYADRDVMNINQGFGIGVNAEDPEMLMTFLETLISPEWQIILSWGEEGIDYFVDANGRFYRNDEQRANANDLNWRTSNRLMALFDQLPKIQGTLPDGNAFSPGDQPEEFQVGLSDYNRFFLEQMGKNTWREFLNDPPDNPPYFPAWQISPPDGSAAQVAASQMDDAAMQFLPPAIMGPVDQFDANWAAYIAQFDLIDVAAFEAVITEGIQERIALFGN